VGNDILPGYVACMKFPWGLSPRLLCFDLRRAHVEFVVDRMVLVLCLLRVLRFPPVIIIPQMSHIRHSTHTPVTMLMNSAFDSIKK